MKEINLNGLFPNLARAYEIAKFGNFSITITYSVNPYDYPRANDDYQLLKKFYNDIEFNSNGDLFVEITKPRNYKIEQCEKIIDIHKRIGKARNNKIPKMYENNSATYNLLKNAVEKLNFSCIDVKKIDKIALKIAQLDGTEKIEAQHIAEAIQYRIKDIINPVIIAENNIIEFGNSIKIKRGNIDSKDIEQAIDYLQSI